ncbi:MAG: GxxExxY protein [Dehalococcoidia bacterium]
MHADESQIGADRTGERVGQDFSGRDYPLSELTELIIGSAMEVHRELGPGFLEKVYETALAHELESAKLRVRIQVPIPVTYKSASVGVYYADLLVEDSVLCELKAVESITSAYEAQLLHYLKATGVTVGLLLNFGSKRLQVKRKVRTR